MGVLWPFFFFINTANLSVKSSVNIWGFSFLKIICICCFPFVATHRQAEHPGGLTSTVPVRQQVLWCGEKIILILKRYFVMLNFCFCLYWGVYEIQVVYECRILVVSVWRLFSLLNHNYITIILLFELLYWADIGVFCIIIISISIINALYDKIHARLLRGFLPLAVKLYWKECTLINLRETQKYQHDILNIGCQLLQFKLRHFKTKSN